MVGGITGLEGILWRLARVGAWCTSMSWVPSRGVEQVFAHQPSVTGVILDEQQLDDGAVGHGVTKPAESMQRPGRGVQSRPLLVKSSVSRARREGTPGQAGSFTMVSQKVLDG